MKNSAFENFSEGVMEAVHDFARCQRADGSYYGTGGQCRKGTSTGAKEKAAPKGKAVPKAGTPERKLADAKADLASAKQDLARKDLTSKERAQATTMKGQAEREVKKLESSGGSSAKDVKAVPKDSGTKSAAAQEQLRQINTQEGRGGGAGKPASASPQSEVRALDKAAKAADKKAEAADKAWRKGGMKDKALQKEVRSLDREAKAANRAAERADKAYQSSQKLQTQTKKLSAEYERLRGNNSPSATARRKKILAAVSKNVSKQKELQKTISAQTPKKPDTSPAANQRRANAAARAKD